MKFLDRHFPLLIWIPKAREARLIPKHVRSRVAKTRDAYAQAKRLGKSLYFDALGWGSVTQDVFEHFKISRWWIYGEGGEQTFVTYLKKNRKGTFYSNLADSYIYQIRNGITDAEMLDQMRHMIEKYNLEELWYAGSRKISSCQEVFDLYHAFINNSHTGEKVIYQSPLHQN